MCVCDLWKRKGLGEFLLYSYHRLLGPCNAVMKYIYQWNEKVGEIRLVRAVLGSDISVVTVAVGGSTGFKPS